MLKLDTTTRKIQAVLSGAITTNQLPCMVSYSDDNGTTYVGGTQLTNTNSTTAVDICAAPGASTVRDIDYLSIRNRDTAAATVTVMLDDNGTDYEIVKAALAVGDQLIYTHGDGWRVIDADGNLKTGGSSGTGDVVGPASATANSLARFDGTTGKLLKDGAVIGTDVASLAANTFTDQQTIQALLSLDHASAGQIKFPATQNASSNANTLDDYEEGTFTPVLTFATPGNLSISYTTQLGSYTKIGRLVTATFNIVSSSFTHTTASGAVLITGMPFTSINVSGQQHVGTMLVGGITKAGWTQFLPKIITNTSQLEIVSNTSGSASSNVVAADMPSGGTVNFRGTITYEV